MERSRLHSTEESQLTELPGVPLTLEGSCVLHQMFHFDWNAWKEVGSEQRHRIETEGS
jgi:peroxiredoxin